ncbi:hypothetical protein CUMW_154150 [Citrus unshiu]|uniref:Uncharacterized protein n=1 Tax=Citrus unshiu TaxID=55188 RepID=A0A2H5PP23_CITUN|nr:hypothetical protein CUMW_154150 [Citrus unshiu]
MSMASVSVIAFLAIFFVLQPLTAPSNFLSPLSPLLAPAFGTLNQDCAPSPSPAQEKAAKKNESIFDRSIGMDCKNMGISVPLPPPPPPPTSLADSSENQAASNLLGNAHWLILLTWSLALVL